MDLATLKTNIPKIIAQRNIFLFFAAVLSIVTILLSCLLFVKKERIIVIPTVGPSLWIEEEKVSDIYLEKMGSYLSDLLLTRTPSDVDRKNQILLEYVHPSFYHEARKQLLQDGDTIAKSNQSMLFRPVKGFIDPIKQTYIVEGDLLIFVGKQGEIPACAQVEHKKYIFEFKCERGKLLLKSLKRENL